MGREGRNARWRPAVLANIGGCVSSPKVGSRRRRDGRERVGHRWLRCYNRGDLGAVMTRGRMGSSTDGAIATRRNGQVWRQRGPDHIGPERGFDHRWSTTIVHRHLSRRERRARWLDGDVCKVRRRLPRCEIWIMRVLQGADRIEVPFQFILHADDVAIQGAISIRNHRLYEPRHRITPVVASGQALCHCLTSRAEGHVSLFRATQTVIHVVERMFERHQTCLCSIGNRLGWGAGLRRGGGFMAGE